MLVMDVFQKYIEKQEEGMGLRGLETSSNGYGRNKARLEFEK